MIDSDILFSPAMIRALLEGHKTMTRRLPVSPNGKANRWTKMARRFDWARNGNKPDYTELLWVRETWRAEKEFDDRKPILIPTASRIFYEASADNTTINKIGAGKTRSPLHMPRWVSRITLTVTDCRIEALHAITEADAKAEGCLGRLGPNPDFPDEWDPSPTEEYRELWNSLHGAASWDANPQIAVIVFMIERRNINQLPEAA